ncbi:hypothetical protein EVAR_34520_1 [Eumeta japonica]|uniref:Uncharacterized protein n=1 Tax=Eumeta variegata TaxID=151549 RepID=A0A4C1Z2P5_EUMVA|nr:hypothetical protein EVAR_34520_1 [Eumeta japonica]
MGKNPSTACDEEDPTAVSTSSTSSFVEKYKVDSALELQYHHIHLLRWARRCPRVSPSVAKTRPLPTTKPQLFRRKNRRGPQPLLQPLERSAEAGGRRQIAARDATPTLLLSICYLIAVLGSVYKTKKHVWHSGTAADRGSAADQDCLYIRHRVRGPINTPRPQTPLENRHPNYNPNAADFPRDRGLVWREGAGAAFGRLGRGGLQPIARAVMFEA